MLNLKKLLTKVLKSMIKSVTTPSISLTGASWGEHYYQDIDVTSYIPSGSKLVGAFVAQGTSGSVLSVSIQDTSNNIVRVINDKSMAGKSVVLSLLVQVGGGTA